MIYIEIEHKPYVEMIDFLIFCLSVIDFWFGLSFCFLINLYCFKFRLPNVRLILMYFLFLVSVTQISYYLYKFLEADQTFNIKMVYPKTIQPPAFMTRLYNQVFTNLEVLDIEFSYISQNYTMRRVRCNKLILTDIQTGEIIANLGESSDLTIGFHKHSENLIYFYIVNNLVYDAEKLYLHNLPMYQFYTTFLEYSLTKNVFSTVSNTFERKNVHYLEFIKHQTTDCVQFPVSRYRHYIDYIQPLYLKHFGFRSNFLPNLEWVESDHAANETFDQFRQNMQKLKLNLKFAVQEPCYEEIILTFDNGSTDKTSKVDTTFYQMEIHIDRKMIISELVILILNAIGIWCNISIVSIYYTIVRFVVKMSKN